MGCKPSRWVVAWSIITIDLPLTDWCHVPRSASSSPEPDNNNDLAGLIKKGGLDPNFIPDPKCGVDIRYGLQSIANKFQHFYSII